MEVLKNESKASVTHSKDLSIRGLFEKYRAKRFLFIQPGGNFGDYLIYAGATKIAKEFEVNYFEVAYGKFLNTSLNGFDVAYIHGSGGFNPWWSGTPIKVLQRLLSSFKGIVIVGPSSFHADSEFLHAWIKTAIETNTANRVILFARELPSFNFLVQNLANPIEIGLDHDTALNLTRNDFFKKQPKRKYPLTILREDKEGLKVDTESNFFVRIDPALYCRSFPHWLEVHDKAVEICSNRLHSAILGTVLGIPTTLLPNSYHKNRSVWEFSLQARGVQWAEKPLFQPSQNKFNRFFDQAMGRFSSKTRQRVLRLIGI